MVIINKEKVLASILDKLPEAKSWQLVSIYNGLVEANVLDMDANGKITCDEDDAYDFDN